MKCQRIILFCLFFLLTGYHLGQASEMVAIAGNNVNMRSGPGTDRNILWKLGHGFPLQILKRSGSWLRVRDFEGTTGWVSKSTVNTRPHVIVQAHRGSSKQINVRSKPGISGKIVAKAKHGVVFKKIAHQNGWVKVRHDDGGVTGWIKGSLLWGF